MALAAVVWWSGVPDPTNTQVSVDRAYATVDDVYAALSRQMGGATPDFETQVQTTLALHLTYAELQAFVDSGQHAPTPTRVTAQPVPPVAAPPVAPTTTALDAVLSVHYGPCTTPAKAGAPGWIDCPGTVTVRIDRPVSSGFVSVGFSYGDDGSFFQGRLQVGTSTGTFAVPIMAPYLAHCLSSFATTVVVRDGQTGGPVLVSQPEQMTASSPCP